jgi:TM2 domain-containing membrane protein YozV
MMDQWYYVAQGQQQGPVPLEHIRHWLQAGQMPANTMVWKEGMANWMPASDVPELQSFAAGPPPPPPQSVTGPQPMQTDGLGGYGVPTAGGYGYGPGQRGMVSDKSRVGYILLGLFLGCFGVHNFYAGYTNKGVAQLLITVLAGWLVIPLFAVCLWVLVEICTVAHDAQGRPFS